MANYAKSLARDRDGAAMQEYSAPFPALVTRTRDNAAVSSITILSQHTTAIEVGAIGGSGVVIRWIPIAETPAASPFGSVVASGLGASYDHAIPSGQVRRFVVPRETQGAYAGAAGSVNGLYQRVANVNIGVASSILLTEY